ncbi:hypothetical protein MRX96_030542 [Rhipicephalus microplus]
MRKKRTAVPKDEAGKEERNARHPGANSRLGRAAAKWPGSPDRGSLSRRGILSRDGAVFAFGNVEKNAAQHCAPVISKTAVGGASTLSAGLRNHSARQAPRYRRSRARGRRIPPRD